MDLTSKPTVGGEVCLTIYVVTWQNVGPVTVPIICSPLLLQLLHI